MSSENDDDLVDLPQLIFNINDDKYNQKNDINITQKLHTNIDNYIPDDIPYKGISSKGNTISVAIPTSFLSNSQSRELKAYVVGQISRALAIYRIDEIVVFEDSSALVNKGSVFDPMTILNIYKDPELITNNNLRKRCKTKKENNNENDDEINNNDENNIENDDEINDDDEINNNDNINNKNDDKFNDDEINNNDLPNNIEFSYDIKWSKDAQFLIRNLAYLETPQYLRQALFKMHSDLKMAGLQNPLGCPHHLQANVWLPFREGVVISHIDDFSLINCGINLPVKIKGNYLINSRVTVKLDNTGKQITHRNKYQKNKKRKSSTYITGNIVSRREPINEHGLYFGYSVRAESSLKDALNKCPFDKKYDLIIGTSERGSNINKQIKKKIKSSKHILIILGGIQGIEECIEDEQSNIPLTNPETLFDFYLNFCPLQGTRTIRTEEALLIILAKLQRNIF